MNDIPIGIELKRDVKTGEVISSNLIFAKATPRLIKQNQCFQNTLAEFFLEELQPVLNKREGLNA